MRQILKLPLLPNGTAKSNIAGILPLSSLIELVDVETKLHCYELSGRGITWNWPITPVGARIILEQCGSERGRRPSVCFLDAEERTAALQCIDMRFAHMYVSANRFTVRTCIQLAPLLPPFPHITPNPYRLQRLDIVHIYSDPPLGDREAGVEHLRRRILTKFSPHWLVVLLVGWALWVAAITISIITACPLALAYFLTLPATGLCINSAFGHRARRLLINELGKDQRCWRRAVVVANHWNETDWTLFVGDSRLVNAILNKPLLHTDHAAQFKHRRFLKPFLRLLIAAQWGLILVASAEQNWDAILISIGIIFCAYTSSFIFRTSDSIASWLTSNHVGIEKMSATFTGRRAMLSAMLAVNPDRQNDGSLRTDWLDPILKPSADRVKWVQQLQRRLFDNVEPDADGMPFLIDFIKEGVQKASYINEWLLRREKYHNVPTRPDPQTPFIITPPKSLQ